jgi:hypothetical protein
VGALVLVLAASGSGLAAEPGGGVMVVTWPTSTGAWQRLGEPRRIDPDTIFDYMDGAGELYLAYRFDHLEIAEYSTAGEDPILAEVYLMSSGDDAYGLVSQDWGGEPVALGDGGCRGLYGAGLLRAWCGTRFVRVLATRETTASRAATLRLAETLLAGQRPVPPPALVAALPSTLAGCAQRPGSTVFLRSDLVLNSVYYLSGDNILSLGPSTEAVVASYAPPAPAGAPTVLLLAISYPDGQAAEKALARFVAAYLPEQVGKARPASGILTAKVEDGWLAATRAGRLAVLAFRCPGADLARQAVTEALQTLDTLEAPHA